MTEVRKKFIPYNGYYYLKGERSKQMNKEWYYLEIGNLQKIISQSDPATDDYKDAMQALSNLTKQVMEIEKLEAEIKRDDEKKRSQIISNRIEIVRTCIGSMTLFGAVILVAAIERETAIPQKLFSIVTKVLPKVA